MTLLLHPAGPPVTPWICLSLGPDLVLQFFVASSSCGEGYASRQSCVTELLLLCRIRVVACIVLSTSECDVLKSPCSSWRIGDCGGVPLPGKRAFANSNPDLDCYRLYSQSRHPQVSPTSSTVRGLSVAPCHPTAWRCCIAAVT